MLQQVKELYAQQVLLEGICQEELPRHIPIVQQLAKENGGLMLPVPRRGEQACCTCAQACCTCAVQWR